MGCEKMVVVTGEDKGESPGQVGGGPAACCNRHSVTLTNTLPPFLIQLTKGVYCGRL